MSPRMKYPKPYFKKSHQRWYVKLNGRHYPLGRDEQTAWERYHVLMAGRRDLGDDPLIADLLGAYLVWCKGNRAPGTYRMHRTYCSSFARSIPKTLKVRDLKPKHLITWVDANWPAAVMSPNTRRIVIRAIQRGLNWAVQMGHISKNPLARVAKPAEARRDTYLWPEQYEQVLAQIRGQSFRDYVEILRHTGCRPEEARIVEARHFFREDQCWILPAGIVKKRQQPRTILLNEQALTISSRAAAEHPEGPMFRNSRGKPWTKYAVAFRFRCLQRQLDFHVTAYSLRHTFATDAILRDVDLITIAEMMGHSDLRMLSQVYQHVSKRREHLRRGLERATEHLSKLG